MKRKIMWLMIAGIIIASIIIIYVYYSGRPIPVILITIDTIRDDHVGCYAPGMKTTPHIDEFAKESVIFLNTYTPIPLTFPSHVSILTGLYPNRHGVYVNGFYRLKPEIMNIARFFKSRNYFTGAVVASYVLNSRYGLAHDFDVYKDRMEERSDLPNQNSQVAADIVTSRSIEVLNSLQKRQDFFLWMHYFDPHAPYTPPQAFRDKFSLPYDGEIAFVDEQINKFFTVLKEKNLYDSSIIIIVGDHGESLGEHDEVGHGYFLYNTTLRIPFLIKFPGSRYGGTKISPEVLTLDIFPTICEYFDYDCQFYNLQGKNLMSSIRKNDNDSIIHEVFYAGTKLPESDYGLAPLSAIMKEGWKYIMSPDAELYHYSNDAKEDNNLAAVNKEKINKFASALKIWLEKQKENEEDAGIKADAESLEKLRALGYLGGGNIKIKKTPDVDVKTMKTTIKVFTEATELMSVENRNEAIELIKNEIKRLEDLNVSAPYMYFFAAQFYASSGEYDDAIVYYKKLLSIEPNYPDIYIPLAKVYGEMKHEYATAIEYLYTALKLDDKIVEGYIMLGNYLVELKRFDEAEIVFKKGVDYFPDDYKLLNSYARMLDFTKRYDDALNTLIRAVQLYPDLPDAYINLTLVYYDKGDRPKALENLQKALEISPQHPLALQIKRTFFATYP